MKPERHTIRMTIGQPGQIEAFEQTPIFSKIPGYVSKFHVNIGDLVRGPRFDSHDKDKLVEPGQVLATLRVPELTAELNQKKALVARAAEEIKQAETVVQVAEAVLKSGKAKVEEMVAGRFRAKAQFERWRVELARAEELAKKGLIDQQTLDVTRFQAEVAKAEQAEVEAKILSSLALVQENEAQLLKARVDVRVAQTKHQVAQADEAYAQALVGYTRLDAPFAGVVTVRNVNTGDFVQPAAGTKGEPLFVVARIDAVRIFLEVPETDAVWIRQGDKVRITVRGLKGDEFTGKVARASWALNTTSRTLRTEIDLDNADQKLRPGMYAFAHLLVEHKEAWTLPAEAVLSANDQYFAFRVENGKAVKTPLQVGLSDGKRMEVLRKRIRSAQPGEAETWEAINGGEEFILTPAAGLKD